MKAQLKQGVGCEDDKRCLGSGTATEWPKELIDTGRVFQLRIDRIERVAGMRRLAPKIVVLLEHILNERIVHSSTQCAECAWPAEGLVPWDGDATLLVQPLQLTSRFVPNPRFGNLSLKQLPLRSEEHTSELQSPVH